MVYMEMTNRRKDPIAYIDFNEDEPDPIHCTWCEKVGVKARLQPLEFDNYQDTPTDADNFVYCPNCKRTIPIYETKQDVEYGPVVDMVESGFDSGSRFAGTTRRSGKRKRRNKKLDKDEDPDILGEKGNVNIVFDSGGNY